MLPRHRRISLLFFISLLGLTWSQTNQFPQCYDGSGVPLRCEPHARSFSFGRAPAVNSTCGDPPESFCRVVSMLGQLSNMCGYVCDSGDPDLAHPAEHMTDFFPETEPTWWQSRNDIHRPDTVVVNFTLGSLVQVQAVVFQFQSLKPDSFYILKSTDNGQSYEPYHYFSRDCITRYTINPQADLTVDNETEVLCQEITNPEPGQISFVPTLDRPSANDSIPGFSDALYRFITATNLVVVLDGHAIVDGLDNSSYHYAIRDINILGRCACNGHASDCQSNSAFACVCEHNTTGPNCERCKDTHADLPWQITNGDGPFECKACQCNGHATTCVFDQTLYDASGRTSGGRCVNCSDNTSGPHCDACALLYYPQDGVAVNDTNYCQSCSCNMAGVVDNGDCVREASGNLTVGSCYCKPNVMGRACDTCKPGFFDLQATNPDGCEVCACNSILSVSPSCLSTGVCECQPNVVGIKCDRCADGFYLADPSGASGCSPCSCNIGGSFGQNCNMTTGQCSCRHGVTGRTCSQALPGYYYPFIDHNLFEAEESTGIFDISFQRPVPSQLFTGRGHARINNYIDLIHFGIFRPQVSGVYELVMRYDLLNALTWEQAELRVDVAGEGNGPAANCTEYTGSPPVFYQGLNMGMAQAASVTLCLRAGRSYNLTLNGFMSGDSTGQAEIFVDSLVVFLQQATDLVTLADTQTAMQYSNCLTQFKSIATRTPMVLSTCEAVSFTVFTEIYNGTRPCDCSSLGSFNTTCQQYGGQCSCRPNVIGRACDLCAAGSYELSPMGCRDCACDSTGSTSEFCSIIGECSCQPGVTGRDCSQCAVGFYNLVAGAGCSDCGCSLNGSVSSQCNETGLCECMAGVGGDNCTQCLSNRYDYPNCRECGCNEAGSTDMQCDLQDGQCPCKINAEGTTCSRCKKGTFNLQTANPIGCQQCFCSGRGDSCASATGFIFSEISTNFVSDLSGWTLIGEGASFDNDTFNEGIIINSVNTTYLQAPAEYLGNRVTSYNQFITLTIAMIGNELSRSNGFDVLIAGNELELIANFSSYVPSAQMQNLTVHLHNTAGWVHRQSGTQATMSDLQTVLVNLGRLKVRVSLWDMVTLSSISIGGASLSTDPDSLEVSWVENCTCAHPNYTGLSCEQCADGYYRDTVSRLCVLCECNGLSSTCDKQSGVCINCSANTAGDHCERCAEGYYGDPLASVPCQACPCPGTTTPGQFSNTCTLQNGAPVCTNCADGHVGDRCEACEVGYFGDPTGDVSGTPTQCSNCTCNGNIDLDDPASCDNITGICLLCMYNTTGEQCERCLDGYYGDPIVAKNCTDCECNEDGAQDNRCDTAGQCSCHANVTGLKCDRCVSDTFNLSSGNGCEPCNCHSGGSSTLQCNVVTGVCVCKTGVMGLKCDQCAPGYYGLDDDGCKSCECSELGSVNQECGETGMCDCRVGVMGAKCDTCQENYFLEGRTGNCTGCDDCYFQLQDEVDSTRAHIDRTRPVVNRIAERNDPGNTFQGKTAIAYTILNPLNASIVDLSQRYTELVQMATSLLADVNMTQTVNLTQLQELVTSAQEAASPVIGLTAVANEIMMRITREVIDSLGALMNITDNILPSVQNFTEIVTSNTAAANATWDSLEAHFNLLEDQLQQLMSISSLVANYSSEALTTAQNVASVYGYNRAALSELEAMVAVYRTNNTQLRMILQSLNLTLMERQIRLESILGNLPTTIPEEDITTLQQQLDTLAQRTLDMSAEIASENATLLTLINMLEQQENELTATQTQLSSLSSTITNLTEMVEKGLEDAKDANMSAHNCLRQGAMVLSVLQNYDEAVSQLRTEADEAIEAARMANDISNMVETRVAEITQQLNSTVQVLERARQQALSANETSSELLQVALELEVNSSMLRTTAQDLANSVNTSVTQILDIQEHTNTTILELREVEMVAENVSSSVNRVRNLPSNTSDISLQATRLVDELRNEYSNTPRPDVASLNSTRTYINMVSNLVTNNSTDAAIDALENELRTLQDTFNTLQSEYASIRQEVDELRQLESMLPPDCDSDY